MFYGLIEHIKMWYYINKEKKKNWVQNIHL